MARIRLHRRLLTLLSCLPLAHAAAHYQIPLAPHHDAVHRHAPDRFLASSVDEYLDQMRPIALERILCNIGSQGCEVEGASPGAVIASPSKQDPDYFYTWTRDSGLVMTMISELNVRHNQFELHTYMDQYLEAQAILQHLPNPSGTLRDGSGLGEPKFHANLTSFEDNWGRPQRDGPPLRAIAIISYAKWLREQNRQEEICSRLWPIIQRDLNYVAQYWNETGFDLWEEVEGSSFFTIASSFRAVVEGITLAESLGLECPQCHIVAPQILCFLQDFWDTTNNYIRGNNVNSILASIHTFDPSLGCDALFFQPCSDRALANHKAVVDAFRPRYKINQGVYFGYAVAIGRYPEDVYYDGQPWYLATAATAEQLYDALYAWDQQGYLDVTETSLGFFRDRMDDIQVGTYQENTRVYQQLMHDIRNYADGFVSIMAKYTPENGSLAEQYSGDDGHGMSARDLTWSYSSLLGVDLRRRGLMPTAWLSEEEKKKLNLTRDCSSSSPVSVIGVYDDIAADMLSSPKTCPQSQVTVTVTVEVDPRLWERYGNVRLKLVGNLVQLGYWEAENAPDLRPDGQNRWKVVVMMVPGTYVEYKYILAGAHGLVHWESGTNRRWTLDAGKATASIHDTWGTSDTPERNT